MRYPAIIVFVVGGIFLLAWLASRRRMPVLVHVGAVVGALATIAFLLWLRSRGKAIEPEAWGAVVAVAVMVYVSYAFGHAMHAEEKKSDGTVHDGALPSPAPVASETWAPKGSGTPLTPDERARAAQLPVWLVHWQLPDKDWEALCLSTEDAERLFRAKQDDHLLKSWGRVGKRDPQSLLAWFEGQARAAHLSRLDDHHRTVREVLRRSAAGEREAVVVRAW